MSKSTQRSQIESGEAPHVKMKEAVTIIPEADVQEHIQQIRADEGVLIDDLRAPGHAKEPVPPEIPKVCS